MSRTIERQAHRRPNCRRYCVGGRSPLSVGRLVEQVPIGPGAVSEHLRVFEGAGLVAHRAEGTRNLDALALGGLAVVQLWMVHMWDGALPSFARFVDAAVHDAHGRIYSAVGVAGRKARRARAADLLMAATACDGNLPISTRSR